MDHGAAVTSLALSKDGAKRRQRRRRQDGQGLDAGRRQAGRDDSTTPAEVRGVGFSPDGGRVVVGGADNRAGASTASTARWSSSSPHEGPVAGASRSTPTASTSSPPAPTRPPALWTPTLLWQASPRRAGAAGPVQPEGRPRRLRRRRQDGAALERRRRQEAQVASPPTTAPVAGVGLSADGTKARHHRRGQDAQGVDAGRPRRRRQGRASRSRSRSPRAAVRRGDQPERHARRRRRHRQER